MPSVRSTRYASPFSAVGDSAVSIRHSALGIQPPLAPLDLVILSEDWSLRDERKDQPERRIPARDLRLERFREFSDALSCFFRPFRACSSFVPLPTACAVGCILALLRSFCACRICGRVLLEHLSLSFSERAFLRRWELGFWRSFGLLSHWLRACVPGTSGVLVDVGFWGTALRPGTSGPRLDSRGQLSLRGVSTFTRGCIHRGCILRDSTLFTRPRLARWPWRARHGRRPCIRRGRARRRLAFRLGLLQIAASSSIRSRGGLG